MTLEMYENGLGEVHGTSCTESVGPTYGSFLSAYLTHHLMNPPEGMSAEAVLARDQVTIQRLVVDRNCVISFNESQQLPTFFKFLTEHVPLYYQLIDVGFLDKDALCEDGTTFLNAYFSYWLLGSVSVIDEAIQLLQYSKSSLTVTKDEGSFPLSEFFSGVYAEETYFEHKRKDAFWKKLSALVDAFSLEKEHALKMDGFAEQCVEFYNKHKNNDHAVSFFYDVLVVAANYGLCLHKPMKGLSEGSFAAFMIKYATQHLLAPGRARAGYLALRQGSQGVQLLMTGGFSPQKINFSVDVEAGVLKGIVKSEEATSAEHAFFKVDSDEKIFDIFIAAKFLPFALLKRVYLKRGDKFDWGLVLGDESDGSKNLIGALLEGKERFYFRLDEIPEAMRFGVPAYTKEGRNVYVELLHRKDDVLSVSLVEKEDNRYYAISGRNFRQEDKASVDAFKEKYEQAFSAALTDPNHYIPTKHYFSTYYIYCESKLKLNSLDYYLRCAGKGICDDPRAAYSFRRPFQRKVSLPAHLMHEKSSHLVYASGDDYLFCFYRENPGEPLVLPRHYDLILLRHLKNIGYDFNTAFVEEFIGKLLVSGQYADPAFYRLLRCFFECGATFPARVEGQPLAAYIQSRVLALKLADKMAACRAHFKKAFEWFEAEGGAVAENVRDYLAAFGFDLPDGCVTKEAVCNYMESDEGLIAFSIVMDARFPNVNVSLFDTRKSLAAFAQSVNGEKGDAKLIFSALEHYLKSGDYASNLKMEDSYYQLYRTIIVQMCIGLKASLNNAMKSNDTVMEKWNALRRSFRSALSVLVKALNEDVEAILACSPGDAVGRKNYLGLYLALCQKIETLFQGTPDEIKKKIESETVRNALRPFSSSQWAEGGVVIVDAYMQEALNVLMGKNKLTSVNDRVGDYVPPVVPADEHPRPEPTRPERKGLTMFPEKARFSAAFLEKMKAYRNKVDALFAERFGGELKALVQQVNEQLEQGVEFDDSLSLCLCPLTKRVPLYPCRLGGELAAFDMEALTQKYAGQVLGRVVAQEGVGESSPGTLVSEENIRFLKHDVDLMLFFSCLQLVQELAQHNVETVKVGLRLG